MKNSFNIIIVGVGGQGIVTLVRIIDEAIFMQGLNFRSSELHGLAQRGGSVVAHIKIGENINSPMISVGFADLIIATELTEALRNIKFANKNTVILINKSITPFLGGMSEEAVIKKLPKEKLHLVESLEKMSGFYLLGYAVKNNIVPLKKEFVLQAIEKVVSKKYLENSIQAFNLVFKNHD